MKCLVVGNAKSGNAVARLLNRHGEQVTLTDMKKIPDKEELENLGICVIDEGHPDSLKNDSFDYIVKNPGIKYTTDLIRYFVEKQIPIYTEIEIAYRYAKNFHYAAVTGTNGKTTITSMLYECLKMNGKAQAAGNIGTPLSELVLQDEEKELDIALELSNFQLLGIDSFAPKVSVVCNLAPDHLDYMPSVESYYESKMNIYKNQTKNDWFLRNVDDALVMEYAQNIPCQIIDFSLIREDVDLYIKDGSAYFHDQKLFDLKDLKVVGMHNVSNAMIAGCMALKMGVSVLDVEKALTHFKGIEHRIEFVGEKEQVRFYNDSKATNTQATTIALASFEKNIILLAGGKDKGISFDDLHDYDDRVKMCITFGQTKDKIAHEFSHCIICETMLEALEQAIQIATCQDVILLSPACSSYDQFDNYEQRGDIFREACLKYIQQ